MKNVFITNNRCQFFFMFNFQTTHNISKSKQVKPNRFRLGARATKTVLKVNPQNNIEPW